MLSTSRSELAGSSSLKAAPGVGLAGGGAEGLADEVGVGLGLGGLLGAGPDDAEADGRGWGDT